MTLYEIKYFIETFLNTKPYVVGNKWVMTNCPFARATHRDGDDKRFSFGISIDNGYHCFTCSEKGHIKSLPFKIWKYLKNPRYIEMLVFLEKIMKAETARKLGENVYVFDESVVVEEKAEEEKEKLMLFQDMPHLPSYVKEFSILKFIEDDIVKWDIRYNFLDQSVLFPIYDRNRQLVNVKARRQLPDGRKTFYFWCKGSKNVWYGEHLLSNRSKYLFLVEGERDAILLSRYVENVLGSMGIPTVEMIKKLPSDKVIVLFFDNDMAGEKIKQKVLKHLDRSVVYVIENYDYKDPAEVVEHGVFEQVLRKIKKIKR